MPRVAIVGAGPAGAALAFVLARRGIDVTLIERQTDFSREFRGEVLMPSGIEAFHQIGLAKPFEALPQARPKLLDLHLSGRFVQRFELPEILETPPRMVSQPLMLEMLVEQCSAFPCFRFVRGGNVSDLLTENGRTHGVRLREGKEEIRADLVVGADGRGSVVRRKAGLHDERDAELFDVVWFKVPMPDILREAGGAVQVFVRPGQACLAFPTFDDRMQVGWIIQKGRYGDLKRRGTDAWLADVAEQLVGPLGEHVLSHRDALEHPFVLDVVCHLLRRWTAPGLLLIGDAAHPMSPVGGQGLNIALRDALVAANHLVPALEAGAAPNALDAACAAVQAERFPEVKEVERLQRIPPRFFFRGGPLVPLTLWLGARLLRLPWLRSRARPPAIAQTFLSGVTKVELQV